MCDNIPTLSVVTPSYNRGKMLFDCYKSLQAQTRMDFEWIIIDDGSTDGTSEMIDRINRDNTSFDIIYHRKENGGKHTALNASHLYIRGKYVLILDSDDTLTPDAVQIVLDEWNRFDDQRDIGLLIFQRKNKEEIVCAYAKDEYVPVDLLSYQRTNVLSSDCCEVIRSELFMAYPFPVYDNEKFVAETALWYRVGLEKKCVYINKPVYICEYLDGGLTKNGRAMRVKNPKGGMYTSYLRMNKRCSLKERIRASLLYVCYGYYAGMKSADIVREARDYKKLVFIALFPGTIMYWKWKKTYR